MGSLRRIIIDVLKTNYFHTLCLSWAHFHWKTKLGRYKDYLQWDGPKSYSAAYGNIYIDGFLVLGLVTMSSTVKNIVVTTTLTRGT